MHLVHVHFTHIIFPPIPGCCFGFFHPWNGRIIKKGITVVRRRLPGKFHLLGKGRGGSMGAFTPERAIQRVSWGDGGGPRVLALVFVGTTCSGTAALRILPTRKERNASLDQRSPPALAMLIHIYNSAIWKCYLARKLPRNIHKYLQELPLHFTLVCYSVYIRAKG